MAPIDRDEQRYGNPLVGMDPNNVQEEATAFAERIGLDPDLFGKAALLIQCRNPDDVPGLQEDEIKLLKLEKESPLKTQKKMLYFTIFLNSIAAAIQGWDQTVISGANLTWPGQLGVGIEGCNLGCDRNGSLSSRCIPNLWRVGFVNATPYIVITLVAWWLADPLNFKLGRRKTIFVSAFFSLIAPLGSGFVKNWGQLVACRALLGIGMGLKETTVPLFSAEISPSSSRGKLLMSWQIWTTVGIFLASASNYICLGFTQNIHHVWRFQFGSAFIPAVPLVVGVLFCPESPRWLHKTARIYMEEDSELYKKYVNKSYQSLLRLRKYEIQAARDLYFYHIHAEHTKQEPPSITETVRRFWDFRRPRFRRAAVAACIIMTAQQLCGINVLAFYSANIFASSSTSECNNGGSPASMVQGSSTLPSHEVKNDKQALGFSMAFAAVNFGVGLWGIPAVDRFGRRFLLLWTIPLMSALMLIVGQCFRITDKSTKVSAILAFVLLFTAAYAPGMGPIPFTYAAEVFPVTHREIGMGIAVAVNNFWGALLALTFPFLYNDLQPVRTFGLFAGLNVAAFILIFLFVPETRKMPLESYDFFFGWRQFTRKFIEYIVFDVGRYNYRRITRVNLEDNRKPEFPTSDNSDTYELTNIAA